MYLQYYNFIYSKYKNILINMGVVRTVKGEDGKPYISIEDLILEIESVKNSDIVKRNRNSNNPNFIELVLKTLKEMETEYYNKYLFKKNDGPFNNNLFNDEPPNDIE